MAEVSLGNMQLVLSNDMQMMEMMESSAPDHQMTAAAIDDDIDDIKVINHSSPKSDSNCKKVWVEAQESELVGLTFDTEDDAYQAYRRYSFVKCFGVRKTNERKNSKGVVVSREFCCYKRGNKAEKGTLGKQYSTLIRRIGCKAMVAFKIVNDVPSHIGLREILMTPID